VTTVPVCYVVIVPKSGDRISTFQRYAVREQALEVALALQQAGVGAWIEQWATEDLPGQPGGGA
jgi:hypothetical protein